MNQHIAELQAQIDLVTMLVGMSITSVIKYFIPVAMVTIEHMQYIRSCYATAFIV